MEYRLLNYNSRSNILLSTTIPNIGFYPVKRRNALKTNKPRVTMKPLILVCFMFFTSVNYAAAKRLPSQIDVDNKISSLGDASAVYVFKNKALAISFRNYGIKCIKYAGRNEKLYAKYSAKLSGFLKKHSTEITVMNAKQAKLWLLKWNAAICQVRFKEKVEISSSEFTEINQKGYLVTLDIRN